MKTNWPMLNADKKANGPMLNADKKEWANAPSLKLFANNFGSLS